MRKKNVVKMVVMQATMKLTMLPLDQVISYDHWNIFCAEDSEGKFIRNISRCHLHDKTGWKAIRGVSVKDYAVHKK